MDHQFKAHLLAGELLVGAVVSLPAPEVTELFAALGFDWLWVDMEHGPLGIRDAQALLQAAGPGCPCLVRVPVGEEVWIKKALDIGAAGIIVPQVNSAEHAQRVVSLCKYPPDGVRGVGLARAQGYGTRFQEYLASANHQLVVVIQAETADAVGNIGSIAQVPGIDAILIGPFDLSSSLGKPGALDDPEVTSAIARVRDACQGADMRLGAFAANVPAARAFIDQGFTLIAAGADIMFLSQAARETLDGVTTMT
ncbi:HpcH/HpaI aldolase/citrate lyase family protein [Chloroflexota bacterium]